MAITRLTDIITVFESKWTYGDSKFGYDGEVNQDHDTQYPLMMVTPPESIMPVVYEGREEYTFEINFYNLYSQAAQSVVTLQKRWDNLQDLSNEWLDMVLKNYQDVTFDIPTKRVSAWSDSSGQSNSMVQTGLTKQPLREGYGGQNDKAYFSFDGTNDSMVSSSNSPITTDFTIFEVSKIIDTGMIFGYANGLIAIDIGTDNSGFFASTINDGEHRIQAINSSSSVEKNHMSVTRKSNKTVDMEYYDLQNSLLSTGTNALFDPAIEFNTDIFLVGTSSSIVLNGNIQEVIVYNRALTDSEITNVRGYLNLKYKIY